MTKVFFKFKKPYFWPLFDPLAKFLEQNRFFPKNSGLLPTTSKQSLAPCQNSGNLKIQFQENTQTDSKMEEQTDPISQDPSGYRWESNRYNCS